MVSGSRRYVDAVFEGMKGSVGDLSRRERRRETVSAARDAMAGAPRICNSCIMSHICAARQIVRLTLMDLIAS